MFQPEFAGEFRTFRSRSDKTHVAAQDIPELRKFVQSEAAKVVAGSRAARIVRHGPNCTQVALGIFAHASEFDDSESAAVQSNSNLAIKNGPAIRQTHKGSNPPHHWEQNNQGGGGYHNIQHTLDASGCS
jgi:hypothetical protein